MKAKKESPITLAGDTGYNSKSKYTKRKRIWPPEYKWRTPNEVLTWKGGLK